MSQSRTPRSTKNTMKKIENVFEKYLSQPVNTSSYSRANAQMHSQTFNPGNITFTKNTSMKVKATTYKHHMEQSAQQQKACYRMLKNEQRVNRELMRLFDKLKKEVARESSSSRSRRSSSRSRRCSSCKQCKNSK